jgi:hypothetical protein
MRKRVIAAGWVICDLMGDRSRPVPLWCTMVNTTARCADW